MSTINYKNVISNLKDSIQLFRQKKQKQAENLVSDSNENSKPTQGFSKFKNSIFDNMNQISKIITETISKNSIIIKAPTSKFQRKVSFSKETHDIIPDVTYESISPKPSIRGILKKSSSLVKASSVDYNHISSKPSVVYMKSLMKLAYRNTNEIIINLSKTRDTNRYVKKIAKINLRDAVNNASLFLYQTMNNLIDKRTELIKEKITEHRSEPNEMFKVSSDRSPVKMATQKSLFNSKQYTSTEDPAESHFIHIVSAKNNQIKDNDYYDQPQNDKDFEQIRLESCFQKEDKENISKSNSHKKIHVEKQTNLDITDTRTYFFKESNNKNIQMTEFGKIDDNQPEFTKTVQILERTMMDSTENPETKKAIEINLMIARINKDKQDRLLRQTRKQEKKLQETLFLAQKLQNERTERLNQQKMNKMKEMDERIKKIKMNGENRKMNNETANQLISSLIKTKMMAENLTDKKRRQPEDLRTEAALSEIKMNHQSIDTYDIKQHIHLHDKYARALKVHYKVQREQSIGRLVKKPQDIYEIRGESLKKEVDLLSKQIKLDYLKRRDIFSEKVRLLSSNNKGIPKENLLLHNDQDPREKITPVLLKLNILHPDDLNVILDVLNGSKKFKNHTKVNSQKTHATEIKYKNKQVVTTPRGIEKVNKSSFHFSENKYEDGNSKRSEISMKKTLDKIQNEITHIDKTTIARKLDFDNIESVKHHRTEENNNLIDFSHGNRAEFVLRPWVNIN